MQPIARALFLAIVSSVATLANAQSHIVLKPNSSLNIGILAQTSVQKELKFDEAKAKSITALVSQLREKMKFQISGGDVEEMKQQLQDQNEEFEANALKEIKQALTADELKRFQELNLQSLGLEAMNTKAVKKFITLTPSQLKIVEAEAAKLDELSQSLYSSSAHVDGDRIELKLSKEQEKELNTAKKSAFKKLEDSFTPEQAAAWQNLIGRRFDFSDKATS